MQYPPTSLRLNFSWCSFFAFLLNDAFFQDYIGIESLFTCSNDSVGFLCPFVKGESFHEFKIGEFFTARFDYLTIILPDGRLGFITRHNAHQCNRAIYIYIKWEEFQDRIQNLRDAVAVTSDESLGNACRWEITVS